MLNQKTDHSYHCSGSNFYSNKARESFTTVTEFLDEYEDADVDMNLCFRFDIHEREDDDIEDYGKLYVELFLIKQRKGIFSPIMCHSYNPDIESERLKQYLEKHYLMMKSLWCEFDINFGELK